MSSHGPSRYIAPAALAAAVVAVMLIVAGSTGDEEPETVAPSGSTEERREAEGRGSGTSTTGTSTSATSTTSTGETTPGARTYRVRPGDTLEIISDRTGVPVEELQELNPDADPQSLTVGQRLRLTE